MATTRHVLTTFIGLAQLLPMHLRALCSCAGLFYAQILCEQDEQIEIQVAALPRYLGADGATYDRHVREIVISYAQLDQMLEYDRCLAGLPTCDLRGLVATQAAQSRRRVALAKVINMPMRAGVATDIMPEAQPLAAVSALDAQPPLVTDQQAEEPVAGGPIKARQVSENEPRYTLVAVEVPTCFLWALNEELRTIGEHQYRPSSKTIHRSLIRIAIAHLDQEREAAKSWLRQGELKSKRRMLQQALRDPQLEITPVSTRRQISHYRMMVDVPVKMRAA